jgi:N-[(2S)-2-amino-2-carboxyethyl]-L-glutamate dehydrogenase
MPSPEIHAAQASQVSARAAHANHAILYLSREDVSRACAELDIIGIVRAALSLHGEREVTLPDEAYLRWNVGDGKWARSLNMPCYLGGRYKTPGTKIINRNMEPEGQRISRVSGVTLLFDQATGRVTCIMEASTISGLRTAAATAISAELFGRQPIRCLALIGAGTLADYHLSVLPARLTGLDQIALFDIQYRKAARLAGIHQRRLADMGIELSVVDSAEEAIRATELVVPVTTVTSGYIPYDWMRPGALLVNISLDDPLPEVALSSDRVFVDDWHLVAADDRRLLGRMIRQGLVTAPLDRQGIAPVRDGQSARAVTAELGQVINGQAMARGDDDEIILVNPFGMSIEDIAVGVHVYQTALLRGLGQTLAI